MVPLRKTERRMHGHDLGHRDLLARHRGIIAVVGSGGKSTLLTSGGRALSAQGARVVLATSTHMLPPSNMSLLDGVERLDTALARDGIAAVGAFDATTGKVAEPPCGIDVLAAHADYVLVEADGSRCLPLKAHAAWEPVIPAHTSLTVLVVGASGFDLPIVEAVHRPKSSARSPGRSWRLPQHPNSSHAPSPPRASWTRTASSSSTKPTMTEQRGRRAPSLRSSVARAPPPYTPDPCEPTGCSAFESRERALRTRSLAERALRRST